MRNTSWWNRWRGSGSSRTKSDSSLTDLGSGGAFTLCRRSCQTKHRGRLTKTCRSQDGAGTNILVLVASPEVLTSIRRRPFVAHHPNLHNVLVLNGARAGKEERLSYGGPGAKVGCSDQFGRLSFTTGFRSPFSASSYAAHSTPYAATMPSGRGWLRATSKRFVYGWSPSSSRSKA
jgi:hypothetical protein